MFVRKIACALGIFVAAQLIISAQAKAQIMEDKPKANDPIAATIDGKPIYLSEVNEARSLLPAQFQGAPMESIYPMLLESLIDAKISGFAAKRLGFDETPEYKHRMERVSDQLLQRILLSRHLQQKITDIAVQERYLQLVERAKSQHEIHARHVLLKTKKEAQDIIAKLDDGDDFSDLAKEFSTGPTGKRGGDLGWFGPGQMVPQFDFALKSIETGTYSKSPVETQFGWHVIKVEDRRPQPIPTLKQSRTGIINALSAQLGQKLMQQLRKDVKIEQSTYVDVVKKKKKHAKAKTKAKKP